PPATQRRRALRPARPSPPAACRDRALSNKRQAAPRREAGTTRHDALCARIDDETRFRRRYVARTRNLRIPWAPIWLAIPSAARTGTFYYRRGRRRPSRLRLTGSDFVHCLRQFHIKVSQAAGVMVDSVTSTVLYTSNHSG